MKKIALLVGLAALCAGLFTAPAFSQATPVSGRTIVYPLENPPTTDSVTQPARFQRIALGSWIMQSLNLTVPGTGVFAGCAASPGTGLAITIGSSVANAPCSVYQVGVSDTLPIPQGYSPNLPADSTVIAIAANQVGTTAPITFTAPGSNSVYWLVESQTVPSDTTVGSRGFFNPITGAIGSQSVNTQRLDTIVYQTKEGTPGASPTKPTVDAGWVRMFYVEITSTQTQVHSGDISDGDRFSGFSTGGGGGCGGGCVLSLEALQGALTLGSSDSSLIITPSGTNIDIKAAVTPGPQATPSPTVTSTPCAAAPSIDGSWPYTIHIPAGCSGGGGGSFGAVSPIVYSTPGGVNTFSCPTCATGSGGGFDAAVLSNASVTHFWPGSDSSGCNSAADAISGGATPVPSPVPLPTPTTASSISCGAPSISNDGETSIYFNGVAASAYFTIPHTVWPASGPFTVFVLEDGSPVFVSTGSNTQCLFIMDTGDDLDLLYYNDSPFTHILFYSGGNFKPLDPVSSNTRMFDVITWDGTNERFYVNGTLVDTESSGRPTNNGSNGQFGSCGSNQTRGRLAKFGIANTAFSQSQIWALTVLLGL